MTGPGLPVLKHERSNHLHTKNTVSELWTVTHSSHTAITGFYSSYWLDVENQRP